MIGVISNTIAILIGGVIGLLARKIIPFDWSQMILKGLGLCSIYIGIAGALDGENSLILILSVSVGAVIGEGLKLEQRFDRWARRLEERVDRSSNASNFAQGFITASLMMCTGAMVVIGSLNAGLKGDISLLLTKTAIDGIGAVVFAASMGMGVVFACLPVFVVESAIVLLAGVMAPLLSAQVIHEITCAGSLLIVALGLNLTVDAKLKIMNYMPAVFLPIIICPLYDHISAMLN